MSAHSRIEPAAPAETAFWIQIAETCRNLAGSGAAEHDIAEAVRAWAEPSERVAVALGALRALSAEEAELVIEAALSTLRGGVPGAPFEGVAAEAWAWADMASPAELRAWAWAAFCTMPAASRLRFLGAASTDDAPIADRKAAFVRLWESFDNATRLDFMAHVDPGGEFRRRG